MIEELVEDSAEFDEEDGADWATIDEYDAEDAEFDEEGTDWATVLVLEEDDDDWTITLGIIILDFDPTIFELITDKSGQCLLVIFVSNIMAQCESVISTFSRATSFIPFGCFPQSTKSLIEMIQRMLLKHHN
jgi:hypothetical protein